MNADAKGLKIDAAGVASAVNCDSLMISTWELTGTPHAIVVKGMSPSVRRTYTAWYFDAKSESSRKNRLDKIIERLNKNLKPM